LDINFLIFFVFLALVSSCSPVLDERLNKEFSTPLSLLGKAWIALPVINLKLSYILKGRNF